jgi:hypothetical protein
MRLQIKIAISGFVLGILVALLLASNNDGRTASATLFLFWPSAIFGIGASGWSDGYIFHIFQTILVFGGNGIAYGLVTYALGSLVNSLTTKLKSGTNK